MRRDVIVTLLALFLPPVAAHAQVGGPGTVVVGGGGSGGSGDVTGPSSSTDNAFVRFDSTTGKIIQTSNLTCSDVSGVTTTIATITPAATTGASVAGQSLAITASPAVASTDTAGAAAGGNITITAGAAARNASGDADGGSIVLQAGNRIGSTAADTAGDLFLRAGNVAEANPGLVSTRTVSVGNDFQAYSPLAFGVGYVNNIRFYSSTFANPTSSSDSDNPAVLINGSTKQVQFARNAGGILWSASNNAENALDTGLTRVAAGAVKVTDGSTGDGSLRVAVGAAATPSYTFDDDPDTGMFQEGANALAFSVGGSRIMNLTSASGLNLVGGFATGISKKYEANTAGSGSPNLLAPSESFAVLTNEGTTAKNYHTLPGSPGSNQAVHFTFCAQDADGLRITASTSDTIRVIDKVTTADGYIESTTIGSCVTLIAINTTEWFATSIHGVWTDGTFTFDDTSLTTP